MPRIRKRTRRSLDTETTGRDFWHGSKPYLVTTYDGSEHEDWVWRVDPTTRTPIIPDEDVEELSNLLADESIEWVMQNAKFDLRALSTIGVRIPKSIWNRLDDTLLMSHAVRSNGFHDLTTLAMKYLRLNVQAFEDRMEEACKECRSWVRTNRPEWRISRKDSEDSPSARSEKSLWKTDGWLPVEVAAEQGLPGDHEYCRVTREYADSDSFSTWSLYEVLRRILEENGLWRIYQYERRKIPRVVFTVEEYGVTLNRSRLEEQVREFREEADRASSVCRNIAASLGYDLELPKGGTNGSLSKFVFDILELPVLSRTKKTQKPQLTTPNMEQYEATLPRGSREQAFVRSLIGKRRRDTAIQYLEGYRRFLVPEAGDVVRLHPSLNPTGTHTLRWSSENPSEHNISKKEGFGVRRSFGPAPGREWWGLDYENLELRIPAYDCMEPAMLELFEHPEKPPYFGSYHLLIFSILHPDKYDPDDPMGLKKAKEKYETTYYKYTKLGNFAELYGAVESSGTADRAFRVKGAQRIVAERLTRKSELNRRWVEFANVHGYVETMPDADVDPERGYRLYCPRTERGEVLPTVPLNYRVQGTACWLISRAMVQTLDYLESVEREGGPDGHMVMQIHDELVLDLPYSGNRGNFPIVDGVRRIMANLGKPIGVKLEVSVSYYPDNWGKSE